ncbi:uncharacterized protein LOC127245106 [Andrographis paniculata]|uniref:uncharacterized protein LOC127245106 n=1 Tax=Andrographis paniculata TaxID=175694 RepID=UPI0021E867DA|nr:uncharacterized protein LOC127245106 [Andrographis paniculata]
MFSTIPRILYTNNLLLHTAFAISLSLLLPLIKIPLLFLHGHHTYIHPDDVNPGGGAASAGGVRAAIRRPSAADSDNPKPRKKSKEKFEFDESKAQIFRLKLSEGHLQSRIYFKEFYSFINSSLIALSSLLLHRFLQKDDERSVGVLENGAIIPLLLGLVSLFRTLFLIIKVGFERSASKKLEKQLSFVFGVLGFFLGLCVVVGVFPNWILEFRFDSYDVLTRICVAVFMGCIVGYLYIPSLRNARAFWVGTDQIRCNLSIISSGLLSKTVVYAAFVAPVFVSLLWISPFSELLVAGDDRKFGLVGSRLDFYAFRDRCLLVAALLQLLAARPNVQTFLNEAVLCWYQRLHGGRVPELDYSRAKVFLHNHYLCLVAVQFVAPPVVVVLLLALSQLEDRFGEGVRGVFPYSVLARDVTVFVSWWIVFVSAVFSSATVGFYRRGSMYVS